MDFEASGTYFGSIGTMMQQFNEYEFVQQGGGADFGVRYLKSRKPQSATAKQDGLFIVKK